MRKKTAAYTMMNDLGNFVDLDDAEKILHTILHRHFVLFGGYSNSKLLFGAATQELSLFLNDNDCANVDAVYDIARCLFEKSYKFYEPHIFEREPKYPPTIRGLLIHFAE